MSLKQIMQIQVHLLKPTFHKIRTIIYNSNITNAITSSPAVQPTLAITDLFPPGALPLNRHKVKRGVNMECDALKHLKTTTDAINLSQCTALKCYI